MASSAITIVDTVATIESDTSEAVITKSALLPQLEGVLVNHGPADVWCKITVSAAPATVVTSGAQAQLQVPLPAGDEIDILNHYFGIAHVTVAGAATLSWRPSREIR